MTTRSRVMMSRASLFCVVVASTMAVVSMGAAESAVPSCEAGKVAFNGKCVVEDECCVEGVCPVGTVFEYVAAPKCVPCADAQTEAGASYCAARKSVSSDLELNRTYQLLIREFPSEKKRLQAAERSWITF